MTKTYLITGCAGFIGSSVALELLKNSQNVIGIDNLNDYYSVHWKRENIDRLTKYSKKRFRFIKADILNYQLIDEILALTTIDYVIHLAARAGVRPSIQQPALYVDTNITGTMNILEACVKHKIDKIIFASSSSVYGDTAITPFKETANTDFPVSQYAATKKAGEALCYTYSKLYGLNITCLRFFTVYGPFGRPDMAPYMFTEAILKGLTLKKYGDGNTSRDYTYIDDIVAGILAAIVKVNRYNIFNLGNSHPVTLNKFIHIVESITGKKALIEQYNIPSGDVQKTYADISKAQQVLGYNPTTSIEEGMSNFINWFSKNRL